uniref:Putative secreted protein n=1 Tax=Anopheles marajoara TaxID=58244 RepID=A0A2M4CEE6_9DIPT
MVFVRILLYAALSPLAISFARSCLAISPFRLYTSRKPELSHTHTHASIGEFFLLLFPRTYGTTKIGNPS